MTTMLDDVRRVYGRALAVAGVIAAWTAGAFILFLTAPSDALILSPLALVPLIWFWPWARSQRGVLLVCVLGLYGGLALLEATIRYSYFGIDALTHPGHYHGVNIPVQRVGESDDLWTMRPGFDAIYEGTRFHVNQDGFRGPDYAREHPGVVRIMTYGSSIAVGASMTEEQAYPLAVAKDYTELTGRPAEGMNRAVIAAGLPQLLELAVESAASYSPDVVVVEVRAGTLISGERGKVFNRGAPPPWLRSHSFAASGLLIVTEHLKALFSRVTNLLRRQSAAPVIPEKPALETLQQGLTALRQRVGDHCLIVVLLLRPMADFDQDHLSPTEAKPLQEIAQRVGAMVVDTHALFTRDELPDELLVFPGDMHPNASVHARVAEQLAKALAARGNAYWGMQHK